MLQESVIVDAVRSPIGKFGGSLASLSAIDLGEHVLDALLKRILATAQKNNPQKKMKRDALVQEVFIGNTLSAGLGQNPARQVSIRTGLGRHVPATTINMVCGSSLKATIFACQVLELGLRDVVIAGGIESMSNAPYLVPHLRWGHKAGDTILEDSMMKDGLMDAIHGYHMGITGEHIAQRWNISRRAQDEFATQSHKKAIQAEAHNAYASERIPIPLPSTRRHPKDPSEINHDEHPRSDTASNTLARLTPAFVSKQSDSGTVTAGNASGINDGAAMIMLARPQFVADNKLNSLARIVLTSTVAIDEQIMGYAPYYVIRDLLERSGLSIHDIDIFEINEAFASQTLAVIQDLKLPLEKVNPLGGAIALGHPIGATGARLITTLAHQLHRLKNQNSAKNKDSQKNTKDNATRHKTKPVRGIASLCIGGGQGCGVLLEA